MIDIIVPTYNRPDDIIKFVVEIQKQTYSDYHVAPTEIVTPEDRLNNILIRYKNTPKYEGYVRDGNNVLEIAHYLEKQYSLDKQQVNEISVKTVVSELLEWELV